MSTMTDEEMEAMMAEIEGTAASVGASDVAQPPKSVPAPKPAPEVKSAEVKSPEVTAPAATTPEVPERAVTPCDVATPEVAAPRVESRAVTSSDGTALKSFIDPDQVKIDISINTGDLDTAMIEHPALELHYATQTAHARRQYERIKSAVEILEAKLDAEIRTAWVGEKKPTEAAIKAAVLSDKRYSSAQSKMIDAQHIWKLCEATESAFHSRKDLLLEVARDRRKEKEGQMRVLEGQEMRESVLKMLREGKAA